MGAECLLGRKIHKVVRAKLVRAQNSRGRESQGNNTLSSKCLVFERFWKGCWLPCLLTRLSTGPPLVPFPALTSARRNLVTVAQTFFPLSPTKLSLSLTNSATYQRLTAQTRLHMLHYVPTFLLILYILCH